MASLNIDSLRTALDTSAQRFDVCLLPSCNSTNATLLERATAGAASGTVVVAETQTAGRGRQGRTWVSSSGDSLTFSLLWRFEPGTPPAGLSLAIGLAVCQALEQTAPAVTPRLKWPNDLLRAGRKLGGILVELLPGAPHAAVIGIGLNLKLPAVMADDLRASSAALDADIDPNRLLAVLLIELLAVLERFARGGFSCLRNDWVTRNAFQNEPVRLLSDFAPPRDGICRGVDDDGALLFETAHGVERILSGEVSLRSAES